MAQNVIVSIYGMINSQHDEYNVVNCRCNTLERTINSIIERDNI